MNYLGKKLLDIKLNLLLIKCSTWYEKINKLEYNIGSDVYRNVCGYSSSRHTYKFLIINNEKTYTFKISATNHFTEINGIDLFKFIENLKLLCEDDKYKNEFKCLSNMLYTNLPKLFSTIFNSLINERNKQLEEYHQKRQFEKYIEFKRFKAKVLN